MVIMVEYDIDGDNKDMLDFIKELKQLKIFAQLHGHGDDVKFIDIKDLKATRR